ncbi:MAG: formate dehydrogenase accessory sulfurtransferase FdhD [Chloroflexota bacterium]
MSRVSIVAVEGDRAIARDDLLAGEEPLQLLAAGPGQEPVEVAVTMRTPGHEDELAVGFLFSEGLIGASDLCRVSTADPSESSRPDDAVTVHLLRVLDLALLAERRTVATASCGICGKASIDDVARRLDALPGGPSVASSVIAKLPARLRRAQETFEATGGLHAAGLFTPGGTLTTLREDVGRHNALDKLIGERYLAGDLPLHESVLLVSGRISFELVQKAAAAGIPILAAVGAPTDLAVATAERVGMTLVGFVRAGRLNIYSRPDRVLLEHGPG